jgi:hypothetical protein
MKSWAFHLEREIMAIVRKFVWGHDDEYGIDGWKPALIPHFNVTQGFGIAHDVLEHFSASDSSINAEFLAFGAILYMRAEGDYWANNGRANYDPADNLYNDVADFLINSGDGLKRPGRTKRLDSDLEEIIDRIRAKARRTMREEWSDDDTDDARNDRLLEWAIGWMRKGYRKAAKRWDINHAYRRVGLFMEIERELDQPRFKHGDYGDTLVISINKKNLDVRVRIDHEYEEY